ncbi:MAG: hypothetical protein QGG40_16805, partial [Myxococcota bacterium]|nr:hypothetical protein [Myxococcota bacterium]
MSSSPQRLQSKQARLWSAAVLATAAVTTALIVLLWPILPAPTRILLGGGETQNHLWGLWVAAEGLWSSSPLVLITDTVNYPEGISQDMADPFHVLLFAPLLWMGGGGLEGAVLGWNGLYAITCVLAGLGGWLLARRMLEDPMGAAVAAAVMASTPCLLTHALSGRTEYLAGAWYPLHLAFLHAHL